MNPVQTPLGPVFITCSTHGVQSVRFEEWSHHEFADVQQTVEQDPASDNPVLIQCAHELCEYFEGKRTHFDVVLDPQGTDFQRRVWRELGTIPFGVSMSYREIARRLGDEKAIRAVATANARNPIAVIIPCHRVIGSDGLLHGYAGGLHRKEWLLRHEGIIL